MVGVGALLMTVLLGAAVAGALAIMALLSVSLVRLEAERQARCSTRGRQLHPTTWANQAWRPADDCLEWCLIDATSDHAEAFQPAVNQGMPSGSSPRFAGNFGSGDTL